MTTVQPTLVAPSVATTRPRDLSLDVAKGVGIILVVIGHAWRGLDSAGMIGNPDLFRIIDTLIYNFHMPLFFLLSGMTFESWALKRTFPKAAISRVTRLLWPLILWTYLFAAARLAAGDAANTQATGLESLAFFPLPPRDHFWFLWALFLQHLVILAVIRAHGKPLGPTVWLTLAAFVILASSFTPVGLNAWTFGAATYAGAFLVGLWIGPLDLRPSGPLAFALAAAAFLGLQALSFQLPASLLTSQILGILLSLAVLVMTQTAATDPTSSILRGLAYLGLSSMGIYLAHTIFSAGIRAALAPRITDLTVHMLAGTVVGIIGPLVIYAIIRKVGRPGWIGF
jgi:fucose 4-O-acetylase-like acetyltransferase